MAIKSDNALDHELVQMKSLVEKLKQTQNIFNVTFANMPPKDRAKTIKQIQTDQRTLSAWLEKAKRSEVYNSGTKFGIENLRQSYQALISLWRKTEKALETFSGPASTAAVQGQSETSKAVDAYVSTLRQNGHAPAPETINQFRAKLEAAYKQAKEKSGGKDLAIKVVQEGPKLKIKIEPK